ncbi:MAG: hypothetical protein M3Z54_04290, partial [Gemmatimonadota bacterium]|nr:hypothetical protein [Gemmatimonadota bacterium]
VPSFSYAVLRLYNFIIQPAAFIRASAIGNVIADEAFDYTMDRELWLRLGRSSRFRRLDNVLAIDRHHPARKSYTRMDLAERDTLRLVQTYGVPEDPAHHMIRKLLKIVFRWLGVSLVTAALRKDRGFGGHADSGRALAFRQFFVPRAAMPMGTTRVSATRLDT